METTTEETTSSEGFVYQLRIAAKQELPANREKVPSIAVFHDCLRCCRAALSFWKGQRVISLPDT